MGGTFEEVQTPNDSTVEYYQKVQVTGTVQYRLNKLRSGTTQVTYDYIHRDHLGSADRITNSSGSIVHRLSYDPFGLRRESNWSSDATVATMNAIINDNSALTSRGFTDHEHLDRTGFIHMNGRLYDPRIGRFVQPDPLVQDPTNTQSYNRYAYVFNSPLSYIDPSGFEAKEPDCPEGTYYSNPGKEVHSEEEALKHCVPREEWYEQLFNTKRAGGLPGQRRGADGGNLSRGGGLGAGLVMFGTGDGVTVPSGASAGGGSTVSERRPTISESLANTERHIAELEALLAMGDDTKPYVPSYTTMDGVNDLLTIASVLPAVRYSRAVVAGLLARPAMVRHHLFNAFRGNSPASQVYRNFFKKHGIDVDAHTVEISRATHLRLHEAGNNWTTKWKAIIDANPNASTKEVYQYYGRLMDEYGIGHVPIGPYRP